MRTDLFVRGRWEPLAPGQRLPSRYFPFYFRFPIGKRHTSYEWAMVLADQHPYALGFASFFCPGGVTLRDTTVDGMEARHRAVKDLPGPRAIYYGLETEFDAGRLEPLRREYCDEQPGITRPNILDFSRCVFGIDQVLPLVQRRGDTGWLIERLLARSEATACTSLSPGADNRGRTNQRRPRRDAKRPEIAQAISALAKSTGWEKASDKERCRLAEQHLNKDPGWCSVRTLGRAIEDHAKQQPIE